MTDCIKTHNLKYSSEKWNYFLRTCHSMYQSTSVFSLRGVMRGSVYIRQSRSALIGPLLGSLRSYWPLVTLLCRSALSPRRSEDPSTHHRGIWNIDWGWDTWEWRENILSLVHCRPITCLFCYQVWDNLPQWGVFFVNSQLHIGSFHSLLWFCYLQVHKYCEAQL